MGGQKGGMVNEQGSFPEVCKKSIQATVADMQPAITADFWPSTPSPTCETGVQGNSRRVVGSSNPSSTNKGRRTIDPSLGTNRTSGWSLNGSPSPPTNHSGTSAAEAVTKPDSSSNCLPDSTVRTTSTTVASIAPSQRSRTRDVPRHGYGYRNARRYRCFRSGIHHRRQSPEQSSATHDFAHASSPARWQGHRDQSGSRVRLVKFRIPSDPRSLFFGTKIANCYVQPHIGGDLALLTVSPRPSLSRDIAIEVTSPSTVAISNLTCRACRRPLGVRSNRNRELPKRRFAKSLTSTPEANEPSSLGPWGSRIMHMVSSMSKPSSISRSCVAWSANLERA